MYFGVAGKEVNYSDKCQLLKKENGNMSDTTTYWIVLGFLALILEQLVDNTSHGETDLKIVANLSQPGQFFIV